MLFSLSVLAHENESEENTNQESEIVMIEHNLITGEVEENGYPINEDLTDSSMFLTPIAPFSIIGEDNREPVDFPIEVIGKLEITGRNGKSYGGTAFLVSDDLILTAGHCLDNDEMGGHATKLVFKAGLHYNGSYIASANATESYLPPQWEENRDPNWDWALLRLDKPIGATVGYETIRVNEVPFGKACEIVGYDVNYSPKNIQLIGFGHVQGYEQFRLYYNADTEGGMSGSPIYIAYAQNDYGTRFAISGIHTNGTSSSEARNSGVRITTSIINMLNYKK